MATKKQKREALLERRAREEEERRQSGLRAQRVDQERRAREVRQAWQEQHDKKHFKFVDECPVCSDIKLQQRRGNACAAIGKMAKTVRQREEEDIDLTRQEIPDGASMEMECR